MNTYKRRKFIDVIIAITETLEQDAQTNNYSEDIEYLTLLTNLLDCLELNEYRLSEQNEDLDEQGTAERGSLWALSRKKKL